MYYSHLYTECAKIKKKIPAPKSQSCQRLMKHKFSRQILENIQITNLTKTLLVGAERVSCGLVDSR